MVLKHNKKRNSGMLGDFFAIHLAESVVSKNYTRIEATKKIWSKHVCSGSELRKEMHLFEALHNKHISNKHVAYDLLSKVKKEASKLKKEKLELEKTALIREINSSLGGDSFFAKPVKNYTELASIQILLNYCMTSNSLKERVINPAMAELEDKILSFMVEKDNALISKQSLNEVLSRTEEDVDCLVVNIMREKLNKKFAPRLTEDQKKIIQQYVFDGNKIKLTETLSTLRDETLALIKEELKSKKAENKEKLMEIKSLLEDDYKDLTTLDENTVTFYMTVSKLNDELKDE